MSFFVDYASEVARDKSSADRSTWRLGPTATRIALVLVLLLGPAAYLLVLRGWFGISLSDRAFPLGYIVLTLTGYSLVVWSYGLARGSRRTVVGIGVALAAFVISCVLLFFLFRSIVGVLQVPNSTSVEGALFSVMTALAIAVLAPIYRLFIHSGVPWKIELPALLAAMIAPFALVAERVYEGGVGPSPGLGVLFTIAPLAVIVAYQAPPVLPVWRLALLVALVGVPVVIVSLLARA